MRSQLASADSPKSPPGVTPVAGRAGSGVYGWLDDQRFDVLAAILGLVIAIALLPLRLIASNLYVIGIPIAIGIASALYLLAIRNQHEGALPTLPIWAGRVLPSVVFLGLAALVTIGVYQGARTDTFYHVAIVVGIALLCQILFTDERDFSPALLLVEVMVFAGVLRFVSLYTTPGYTGIDVWSHVPTWSAGILEERSLAPLLGDKYYGSPLFHLLVVSGALLFDTSVHGGLLLSIGVPMVLGMLFVYVTARLFAPARWSLVAVAMYAISGYTIEWGIHLIPTSIGLIFFLGVFYLLCRVLYFASTGREFLFIVLLSVATILSHQISAFIMVVLTGAGLVAHLLLQFELLHPPRGTTRGTRATTGDSVNLTGLLAFDVGFITFTWSLTPYRGSNFLETVFSYFYVALIDSEGFGDLAGERDVAGAPPIETTFVEDLVTYIDALAYLSVFLLMVLGALFVVRRRNISHATMMIVMSIMAMAVFVFGFPMVGVNTFIPNRWYAFMLAPMVVLAAIGLAYLDRESHPAVLLALVLVVALVFPAVSIVSSSGTIDQPRFDSAQTRYSYTETELAATDTFDERVHYEFEAESPEAAERVHTDHPYHTVFTRTESAPASSVTLTDDHLATYELVVFREYQTVGAAYFGDEYDRAVTPEVTSDELAGADRHRIYHNGDVEAYAATWDTEAAAEELDDEETGDDAGPDDGGGGEPG